MMLLRLYRGIVRNLTLSEQFIQAFSGIFRDIKSYSVIFRYIEAYGAIIRQIQNYA